jgi:hypothetical protein
MSQIQQLTITIIPLLTRTQPIALAVRDQLSVSGKSSFELISRWQSAPEPLKKRRNIYRLETLLMIWEKKCALAVARSLLLKRAGL